MPVYPPPRPADSEGSPWGLLGSCAEVAGSESRPWRRHHATKIDQSSFIIGRNSKTVVRIACSSCARGARGCRERLSASVRALRPSPRALTGPTRASYPWATSGALWLRISHVSTRTGAFERRLPPAAVLRAPLGRPHRCAARSRSSAILIYHVVTRATATCAAERPESFAAPRKRSGTLPRTSLSGARSTKTLDMLLLGPSRRPHAPVDWTGRADAPTRLDLRPPGPRTLTRPTWPEDAAVATGTIARPPPRLNYVHASSARRGF